MTNLKYFINTALETKYDLSNQNLKTIEEKAFAGDELIEVVQLPDTINEIQTGSFENCTKLKSIIIGLIPESQKNEEETVIFTKVSDYSLFPEDQPIEVSKPTQEEDPFSYQDTNLLLVEYQSFKDCKELRTIVILTESKGKLIIEKEAFSGCTNLRTLYISSNFKDISISDTAFEDCSKLTIISKQDSNSEIARYAREHKIRFINA